MSNASFACKHVKRDFLQSKAMRAMMKTENEKECGEAAMMENSAAVRVLAIITSADEASAAN